MTAATWDLSATPDDADACAAIEAEAGAEDAARPAPPTVDPWTPLVTPVPAAWFTTAPPARAWLLRDARRPKADGVLPLGKVGQIIGEGGTSKTMLLLQLAIAVATGSRWLDTFDVAIPGRPDANGKPTVRAGRVLAVVGEEDAEEVHRRLFKACRAVHAPTPADDSIVVLPLAGVPCPMLTRDEHGEPADAPFLAWLRSYVAAHGPWDMIIVDPLSRFAGSDAEIDNAAGTRFVQSLESIAALTGATVLCVHHTNKVSRKKGQAVEASAGRGSSALVDGVRWQASLAVERVEFGGDDFDTQERLGEVITWAHTKSNYSRRAADVILRHDPENGGALVPCDEDDLIEIENARKRAAERAGEGGAKGAARRAQQDARDVAEDAAVLQAVADRPGIPLRDLVKAVMAIAKCGSTRAEVAIFRAGPRLDVRPGPRNAQLHYLRGTT